MKYVALHPLTDDVQGLERYCLCEIQGLVLDD